MRFFAVIALVGAFMQAATAAPATQRGQLVPNKYIVVLKDDVNADQAAYHKAWLSEAARVGSDAVRRVDAADLPSFSGYESFKIQHNFGALNGYAAELTPEIAEALKVSVAFDLRVMTKKKRSGYER
jgi:hypothetical protein